MKKSALLITLLIFTLNLAFTQGVQKNKMFGINPLGLLFNIYSGHIGSISNDGTSEVNFPFFYFSIDDNFTLLGLGAKYRIYKTGMGRGIFYGASISVSSIDWSYESIDSDWNLVTENITAIAFSPGLELGYRWRWYNGFTMAPSIGANYNIGKLETSDGVESDSFKDGLDWSLGLGLAYMF